MGELHHRSRARAEDRIRAARDTGAANFPVNCRVIVPGKNCDSL